jgi:hypothetical protein
MRLSEFVDAFTLALYHHTERQGGSYHRAQTILDLYGLVFKPSWEDVIFDDFDFHSRIDSSRSIGRFGQQSLKLSAHGVRWVEEDIGDDNVGAYLEQFGLTNPYDNEKTQSGEVESIERRLIPASDREVSFGDNLPKRSEMLSEIHAAEALIRSSNEMDEDDKADAVLSLGLGAKLIRESKRLVVGAVRYLVLDRLKKAFEGVIEDAFKLVLIAAFVTIGTILLALI